MVDMTLYNARQTAYLEQTKDYEISSMKEQIKYEFKSNPSYFQIVYNNVNRDVHIVDNNKSFTKKVGEKKLLGYPNDAYAQGDYLTLLNKIWIILSRDEESQIQEKCYISVCNSDIVLNENGVYKVYPSLVESSSLSIGIDENNPFDVGDDIIRVRVKKDNNTINVVENQRFIFGNKRCYKVTKIDDFIGNIVSYTMQRDAFNPTTDQLVTIGAKQYWIANYTASPTPIPIGTEIIITPNTDTVKKTSTSGIDFTATKYTNGLVVPTTFTFTIESNSTGIGGTDYVFTVVDSDTFNVKSLSMNKYINVKIQDNSSLLFVVKKINLLKY